MDVRHFEFWLLGGFHQASRSANIWSLWPGLRSGNGWYMARSNRWRRAEELRSGVISNEGTTLSIADGQICPGRCLGLLEQLFRFGDGRAFFQDLSKDQHHRYARRLELWRLVARLVNVERRDGKPCVVHPRQYADQPGIADGRVGMFSFRSNHRDQAVLVEEPDWWEIKIPAKQGTTGRTFFRARQSTSSNRAVAIRARCWRRRFLHD